MIEYLKDITYGNAGGVALQMDVARPVGASNLPAVIVIHGGGWYSGKRADLEPEARGLAEAGYVAFNISYRLTAVGGDPYAVGAVYPDSPDDAEMALVHVLINASSYGANPERVAMFGTSAGGHLALLTSYRNVDVTAVAGWSAPVEMKSLYQTSDRRSRIGQFMGGSPRQIGNSRYAEASPLTYASAAPPTLLISGTRDTTVPQAQAKMLQTAIGGSPQNKFIYYVGDTHGVPQHRAEALAETISFFGGVV